MTNFQCHYESLKVTRDAPPEVIRAAYRSLSQKHHPDKNSGNPEAARMMSRLNLAYSVLSDAVQRELYDLQLQQQRARAYYADFAEGAGMPAGDESDGDDVPRPAAGRGSGAAFAWLQRYAYGRSGRVAATVLALLALGFAALCWSIWNEQRSMLRLEQAAIAARGAAGAPDPGPVVATAPPVAAAAAPIPTTGATTAATAEPPAAPTPPDVRAAVTRSSEYERLTALLKSMGLGLHKLDLPAQAARRAAAPAEPDKATAPASTAPPARAPAANPVAAAEPARPRDETPAAAEPVRADAKAAPEAARANAAPAANASVEATAPRQPVIVDARACAPAYPAKAHGNGESGTVRMALLVGGDGNVLEAKVRKSSGSTELDRAARKALSQCKFKVADSDRQAEPVWTVLEYVFKLE